MGTLGADAADNGWREPLRARGPRGDGAHLACNGTTVALTGVFPTNPPDHWGIAAESLMPLWYSGLIPQVTKVFLPNTLVD